jgi:NAD(P)-dependent dehydrogenase (short-subunit alcohol dehydrogenase family)
VLSARRTDLITQEAERLTAAGHQAVGNPADVTDAGQVESLVARTVETFGRLDYAFRSFDGRRSGLRGSASRPRSGRA